jgi:hypothetical protein
MTAAIESIRAIEVARISVWTADLPGVLAYHNVLESDVDDLLEAGQRNEAGYGEQTTTTLHDLNAPHWKYFFSEIRRVILDVVATSGGSLDEGVVHLRAWASRLRRDGNYSERYLRLSALHNHSPAFLSAVYYLRIPKDLQDGDGGTFFVNPFPHPLASPRPGLVVPAVEGRVILFPSSLLHGPAFLDYRNLRSPRVVIAVDAHLIPK